MKKKYKIPVYFEAMASMYIGDVECDNYDEFIQKRDELIDEKDPYFPNYACNPFDLSDGEVSDFEEKDMEYYKNND